MLNEYCALIEPGKSESINVKRDDFAMQSFGER